MRSNHLPPRVCDTPGCDHIARGVYTTCVHCRKKRDEDMKLTDSHALAFLRERTMKIKVELTPQEARAFIRTYQLIAAAGVLRNSEEPLALTKGVRAVRDALLAQGLEL